jgi:hypothetical protein
VKRSGLPCEAHSRCQFHFDSHHRLLRPALDFFDQSQRRECSPVGICSIKYAFTVSLDSIAPVAVRLVGAVLAVCFPKIKKNLFGPTAGDPDFSLFAGTVKRRMSEDDVEGVGEYEGAAAHALATIRSHDQYNTVHGMNDRHRGILRRGVIC